MAAGINVEEKKVASTNFKLKHVIGRRAYDRRNNIKLDSQDRITYIAGSLIVFLTENKKYYENEAKALNYPNEVLEPNREAQIK